MSKKDEKVCFTILIDGKPYVNTDTLENGIQMSVGLHKMFNLPHNIRLSNPAGEVILFLESC